MNTKNYYNRRERLKRKLKKHGWTSEKIVFYFPYINGPCKEFAELRKLQLTSMIQEVNRYG